MNCQEVTELMQRQLDDDLRESEMEVLMNHTRHCPDCAAMFERLTRLSAELNNLPKVTPAYSLVDAIMPELIRIDNETKHAETLAVPATTYDQGSLTRRTQRTRRWPSWKSISGVVAAGIVAGIFLVTYPPQSSLNDQDKASSIGQSAAEMEMKEDTSIMDVSPLSAKKDPGGDAAADAPVDGPENLKGPYGLTEQNGNSMEPESGFNSGGSEALPNSAQRNSDVTKPIEEETSGGYESTSKHEPDMGITGHAMLPSPDGQYMANVDGFSIVILSASDSSTLFQTERKNGLHVNLVWAQDSASLTYEVSLDHGAAQKYEIAIPSFEERKAD
ncbi:hypothetical protein B1748_07080 [Paenibacillus sp. MY03]|uniref:anti-sigma factor family protein n=1 Tax=Paenibacillus sp. MY03 TaxID=302980 RepID=UPI000B3D0EEF|nr:zf-HC2 domain-containing protein [Paenibacillus sp. MY03]OUS77555.1 hypothetical protein B1748_07080 [Paenibacillus sp. MY03]